MSRRNKNAGGSARSATDSFANFAARVGSDPGSDNLLSQGAYNLTRAVTRNRVLLDSMYRTAWVVGKIVDAVAEDMTRAGTELTSKLDPAQTADLEARAEDIELMASCEDGIRWGRLYGGAIGVFMVDGHDLETPFRPEMIRRGESGLGTFQGIKVFSRWELVVDSSKIIHTLGPLNGLPEFYSISNPDPAWGGKRVHHTRVIRFIGGKLPYYEHVAEMRWGMSIVEQMYDRLLAFDSTTHGAANLVFQCFLRAVKVEGLRDAIAAGGKAQENVIKMFTDVRRMQSNTGLTILDKNDEFETQSYTFAGLSDILLAFGQQLAGATGIPMVRLFGQSPAGLNATGDADLRNYYDAIKSQQVSRLRPGLKRVYDVLGYSVFGTALPKDFAFTFRPLWQLSDKEKAEIAKTDADSITALHGAGLLSAPTAMRELKQGTGSHGRFSNITDEDIEQAEKDEKAPLMPPADPVAAAALLAGKGNPPVPSANNRTQEPTR